MLALCLSRGRFHIWQGLSSMRGEALVDFQHVGLVVKESLQQDEESKQELTVTPIAVRSPPAPGPWIIKGRAPYLTVFYQLHGRRRPRSRERTV